MSRRNTESKTTSTKSMGSSTSLMTATRPSTLANDVFTTHNLFLTPRDRLRRSLPFLILLLSPFLPVLRSPFSTSLHLHFTLSFLSLCYSSDLFYAETGTQSCTAELYWNGTRLESRVHRTSTNRGRRVSSSTARALTRKA